jgi:hypothetical protein
MKKTFISALILTALFTVTGISNSCPSSTNSCSETEAVNPPNRDGPRFTFRNP